MEFIVVLGLGVMLVAGSIRLRMDTRSPASPPAPRQDKPAAAQPPAVLASADLLRGGKMVEIHHNGEVYRLQATRLGKLILTK